MFRARICTSKLEPFTVVAFGFFQVTQKIERVVTDLAGRDWEKKRCGTLRHDFSRKSDAGLAHLGQSLAQE